MNGSSASYSRTGRRIGVRKEFIWKLKSGAPILNPQTPQGRHTGESMNSLLNWKQYVVTLNGRVALFLPCWRVRLWLLTATGLAMG